MSKFTESLNQWSLHTKAEWYQFWLPQSSFYGGCIMGCVVFAVGYIAYRMIF